MFGESHHRHHGQALQRDMARLEEIINQLYLYTKYVDTIPSAQGDSFLVTAARTPHSRAIQYEDVLPGLRSGSQWGFIQISEFGCSLLGRGTLRLEVIYAAAIDITTIEAGPKRSELALRTSTAHCPRTFPFPSVHRTFSRSRSFNSFFRFCNRFADQANLRKRNVNTM